MTLPREGDRLLELVHPDRGGVEIRRVSIIARDDWVGPEGPASVVVVFADGTALIVADSDRMVVPEVSREPAEPV